MPLDPKIKQNLQNDNDGTFYHDKRPLINPPQSGTTASEDDYAPQFNSSHGGAEATVQQKNRQILLYSVIILAVVILVFAGIGFFLFGNEPSDSNEEEVGSEQTSLPQENDTTDMDSDDGEDLPELDPTFEVGQSYSNEFFPGTTVAYSDQWEYSNETELSEYEGLIRRTIILSNGTSRLTMNFRPKFIGGCIGENQDMSLQRELEGSNLSRYSAISANTYNYLPASTAETFASDCIALATSIPTTIDAALVPQYQESFPGDTVVESLVVITLESSNPQHIVQADAMIAASQFNVN